MDYKRGDPGHGERDFLSPPEILELELEFSPHVLPDSYRTTKYTDKHDVELLFSGRPELG